MKKMKVEAAIRSDDDRLQHQHYPRTNALKRLQNQRMKRKAKIVGGDRESISSSTIKITIQYPTHPDIDVNNTTMQFLFEKKLKQSDVKREGRIIIPKAFAEKYMPGLESNYGHHMLMDDMVADRIWMFRFRFWQNNASRVYVLESTGELVQTHGLQAGDFIMIYKDKDSDKYGIRGRKCCSTEHKEREEMIVPNPKPAAKSSVTKRILKKELEGCDHHHPGIPSSTTFAHHHHHALSSSEYNNGLQGDPMAKV